jgi:hypothetical protein
VWVRLYARGWPPSEAEIAAAAIAAVRGDEGEADEPLAAVAAPVVPPRRDSLIEID